MATATVSREIIEERWRASTWRPARFSNETGHSPLMSKTMSRVDEGFTELAARLLGSDAHGEYRESAVLAIVEELHELLQNTLVDWAVSVENHTWKEDAA